MLEIGSYVDGKYKVLNVIGKGGMSVVYLALNERANKTWAIKEIRKDGVQDFTTVKQGLIAETNILKSLNHKYLPSIVDVIDDHDTFLIVMDYIQGKSLNVVLRECMETEGHPVFVEDVISWGIQLCDVFYYLHTRPNPIIYRDMKPANVMLKPDGEICVVDFGTARIFKTGNTEDTTCLGTPGYAAPEQYGGNGQTRPQTDIYNLGATLHHLITGRNPAATPFNFPPITQCRPSLLDETPRELRGKLLGLEIIINKCTQYEIKDRYQTALELKYDLEHPEDLGAPYRRSLKRKMFAFVACAAVAVALGGVSLGARAMETQTKNSGYDYYIQEADKSSGDEKIELCKQAIEINPKSEEAYLLILEELLDDNEFSDDDYTQMNAILGTGTSSNKTSLQTNESGYVVFAYEMGLACYYSSGSARNTTIAESWFNDVANTDLEELDLDDLDYYESKSYDLAAMKIRAKTLGTICSYTKQLGVTNKAGDSEVSYADYWYDLLALFDEDVAGTDNVVTELRLYNEIVYQIYNNVMNFKSEDITQEEMEQALDDIEVKMEVLDTTTSTQAQELVESITSNIEKARKMVASAFSQVAVDSTDSEEGGEE